MDYTVYIHTNKINGKRYVGITCQKPERRWRNGHGYKECPSFYNAIRKYGWDAFKHEIFQSGLSKEKAEHIEKRLIALWGTNHKSNGYNIENGGNTNGKHSEITKAKIGISNILYNINNPSNWAGKKHSPETIEKIRKAQTGKVFSEEHRANLSKALKGLMVGERNGRSLPVICDGQIFPSVKECAYFYGVGYTTMIAWLKGYNKMPSRFVDGGLQYYNEGRLETCAT